MTKEQVDSLNELVEYVHQDSIRAGWWTNLYYRDQAGTLLGAGVPEELVVPALNKLGIEYHTYSTRNVGEMLCLIHSEISEAMEGYRKNLMDDKLPHRPMIEVELADAMIRIMDLAGSQQMDLAGAIKEKLEYNATRADHKIENRLKENGKKF